MHFWHFVSLLEDVSSVLRKVEIVEFLGLNFNLVHVDDLRQKVVVGQSNVVDDVSHLLLDALVSLNPLGADCILQLRLRKQFFGKSVAFHHEEPRILVRFLVRLLPNTGLLKLQLTENLHGKAW